MKQYSKALFSLLALFFTLGTLELKAQEYNINGDTLFVNTELETQVLFPGTIELARIVPEESAAQYRIRVGEKSITVKALGNNTKYATLRITEGTKKTKREHIFAVVFKRSIATDNIGEYIFDYSEKKKLKAHVKQVAAQRAAAMTPGTESKPSKPAPVTNTTPASSTAETKEFAAKAKQALREKPRLDLTITSKAISLQCQSISFIGNNAYFKFSIQNNDERDLLAGMPALSTGKKKKSVELKMDYMTPSPLPVIYPGSQLVFIFTTKIFEATDQDKIRLTIPYGKKKLELIIPGTVYLKEKNASAQ